METLVTKPDLTCALCGKRKHRKNITCFHCWEGMTEYQRQSLLYAVDEQHRRELLDGMLAARRENWGRRTQREWWGTPECGE